MESSETRSEQRAEDVDVERRRDCCFRRVVEQGEEKVELRMRI